MTLWTVTGSWYTPAEITQAARAVMGGIDLDPASCADANEVIKANHYFTREDDGLAQDWFGKVWMNSPTDTIGRFVDKFLAEWRRYHIEQAVVFTHNATEADWHQALSASAFALCMPAGRIQHWRPAGSGTEYFTPEWGQSIFYFGGNAEKFSTRFQEFGTVWTV